MSLEGFGGCPCMTSGACRCVPQGHVSVFERAVRLIGRTCAQGQKLAAILAPGYALASPACSLLTQSHLNYAVVLMHAAGSAHRPGEGPDIGLGSEVVNLHEARQSRVHQRNITTSAHHHCKKTTLQVTHPTIVHTVCEPFAPANLNIFLASLDSCLQSVQSLTQTRFYANHKTGSALDIQDPASNGAGSAVHMHQQRHRHSAPLEGRRF